MTNAILDNEKEACIDSERAEYPRSIEHDAIKDEKSTNDYLSKQQLAISFLQLLSWGFQSRKTGRPLFCEVVLIFKGRHIFWSAP